MKNLLPSLLACSIVQLLAGCVVYMPMQCAAPQITDKKQAEVTASTYLNGRFEIAGTYSPVPHLLVRAASSSLRDDVKDSTYYRGRQYDVSLGSYWQLSPRWLVGGLGGYGKGRSAAGYSQGGFLLGVGEPVRHDFDVRFNKLFGEAYGIYQPNEVYSVGAAYRVTQVNFTTLTDAGVPLDLRGMVRSEPMVFVRARLGQGSVDNRPVQFQVAWGSSTTFGDDPKDSRDSIRDLKQGRGYMTVGISIFPHCLLRKEQSAGAVR
ncbi:hypothetical protein [Hymenobacter sp.]|uniref:hypothetical protein n=1 Tax=Hymenobacter sp. TaxID=1898978 RepID=UPI00286C65D9|nr:hypothetical protein [Hymenobacter sp.]